jgi:hypothetical protein
MAFFFALVLFPLLTVLARRQGRRVLWALWLVHLGLAAVHEAGIPAGMDIRVDLLLIVPSLLVHAVLALWWGRAGRSV